MFSHLGPPNALEKWLGAPSPRESELRWWKGKNQYIFHVGSCGLYSYEEDEVEQIIDSSDYFMESTTKSGTFHFSPFSKAAK